MKQSDLKKYAKDSKKEGFCVLDSGGDKVEIYQNPKERFKKIPSSNNRQSVYIGYLAYPNIKLKNTIPQSLFFEYESSTNQKKKKAVQLADNALSYQTSGKVEQSVSKIEYIKKIQEIKKLLSDGEIYQITYAIRFRKKFKGSAYGLFLKLIEKNPSAFSAFINCGDFQIISNSPERFFKLSKGKIITEPIKGTASKTKNFQSKNGNIDPKLKELLASPKERAELDMITDLERNDIGKVCEYGSLKLEKEREIMELSNLYHTYSKVSGNISKNLTNQQVIEALFPGGSITGCPKIRAMQYIEKLEALPRNIFTGSIFRIQNITLDSSICIRTAFVQNGYIEYWAGGGIVADSNPESEYFECLLKAEKFLKLI